MILVTLTTKKNEKYTEIGVPSFFSATLFFHKKSCSKTVQILPKKNRLQPAAPFDWVDVFPSVERFPPKFVAGSRRPWRAGCAPVLGVRWKWCKKTMCLYMGICMHMCCISFTYMDMYIFEYFFYSYIHFVYLPHLYVYIFISKNHSIYVAQCRNIHICI